MRCWHGCGFEVRSSPIQRIKPVRSAIIVRREQLAWQGVAGIVAGEKISKALTMALHWALECNGLLIATVVILAAKS